MSTKGKVFTLFLSVLVLVSIVAVNAYASNDNSPGKEVTARANGIQSSTSGSLGTPKDKAAVAENETKLDGSPIRFQPSTYSHNEDSSKMERTPLGDITEIRPLATTTFPDMTLAYNTRVHFTRSGGDPFIIRKGVKATFHFSIRYENSHYQVGFMDKDLNIIEVLEDHNGAGGSFIYTPTSDVEGFFYVWNKAADDIELEDIYLKY